MKYSPFVNPTSPYIKPHRQWVQAWCLGRHALVFGWGWDGTAAACKKGRRESPGCLVKAMKGLHRHGSALEESGCRGVPKVMGADDEEACIAHQHSVRSCDEKHVDAKLCFALCDSYQAVLISSNLPIS
eukprot:1154067-Pelagomonas_calceolata.AAC.2